MGTIFDGKRFAKDKEEELKTKVSELRTKPKLVSILLGNDKASLLYTNLKEKTAKRIGAKFEIKKLPSDTSPEKIIGLIIKLNNDKKVNGIMLQLPLPKELSKFKIKILNSITPEKDVDGLTKNSPYTPATAKAVVEIIKFAITPLPYIGKKAAVVGANGTVGKSVTGEIKKLGFKVTECDKDTRDIYAKLHEVDLVVSVTGEPKLIKSEMLKEGVIAIDVGAPDGDLDFSKVSKVASFVTPVPGGVGPVTIVSLLENLIEAVYNSKH